MLEKRVQDLLMTLDRPPNLEGIRAIQEQSALRTALSEAQHWFKEWQTLSNERILIEDAQRLWATGKGPRNYRITLSLFWLSVTINAILIYWSLAH